MTFLDFRFDAPIQRAIEAQGYQTPTPIQAAAIPAVRQGRDVIGCAQTGTGKTAAFALPALQHLLGKPRQGRRQIRTLVIAPTRELAEQIRSSFTTYGAGSGLSCAAAYGGVAMGGQIAALKRGVDVLVACPGRLLDLMNRGIVRLDSVEMLVLDEADRMLDMGFAPDIRRIVAALPSDRQSLLFSATMPAEVRKLAKSFLRDPLAIAMTPESPAAETVAQLVYYVDRPQKTAVLHDLLRTEPVAKAVVFTRTKHGADRLARKLERGGVRCRAIHGDKSQGQRTRAMDEFRSGRIGVLVASDIAARGLDVDGISHVVNFDLPHEADTYVHRIGRCGRAGADGVAWSLCAPDEKPLLAGIQRTLGRRIDVADSPRNQGPAASAAPDRAPAAAKRTPTPIAERQPARGAKRPTGKPPAQRFRGGRRQRSRRAAR